MPRPPDASPPEPAPTGRSSALPQGDTASSPGAAKTPLAAGALRPGDTASLLEPTWLVRLRWALSAAQLLVLLFIDRSRGGHLHLPQALTFVGLGVASNLLLALWLRRGRRLAERTLGLVLAFDIVQLTALLTETGGYASPLSFLYLVHVAIAAVAMGRVWPWVVVALAFGASLALVFHHSSTPHEHAPAAGPAHDAPAHDIDLDHREHARMHLQGLWISFFVLTVFVARVKRALAGREAELAGQRDLVLRSEKLASLATLAAGAAHELSTPLGTIATVAREMERRLLHPVSPELLAEDARLVRQEVQRCRAILDRMAADAGATAADATRIMTTAELLAASLDDPELTSRVEVEVSADAQRAIFLAPPLALAQALRSALRNAVDASPSGHLVRLRVATAGGQLRLEVADRGPGMAEDVLARAGEPFFTTKEPGHGTGLGLFLTRAVLERAGGSLRLESAPSRGTTAILTLPLRPAAQGSAT